MKNLSFGKLACIVATLCMAAAVVVSAQTLTTLVNFNGTDGNDPDSPLVQSTDGNFYGVTYSGGTPTSCLYANGIGCGTFFKMTPAGALTILHSFCSLSNCADGGNPGSLIQAANGNFYGVTTIGGASGTGCVGYGCGTVFEITPSGKLTSIYNFCTQTGCPDGSSPSGLMQATDGNFYGTTFSGGDNFGGTVFQLTTSGKFGTLYRFCAKAGCADGSSPGAQLVQASNKNLYGSTTRGGPYNGGTLFVITPAGKLTTLHSFKHGQPNTMIQGADGDLYGTTAAGGTGSHGIVFKMTPAGRLTTLHNFCPLDCATGDSPVAGLAQGSDGNFYGTTALAGNTYYAGSLFEITPTGTFTTLYLFCAQTGCPDGWEADGLIQATNGNFYGTTAGGGTGGYGTVFSLSTGLGPFVAAKPQFGPAGQIVTILGNNLTGTTSVTFNGTAAKFKVLADSYLKAEVPSGATTGTIEVTIPRGTLKSNVPFEILP